VDSVLARVTPSDVVREPFPHVVIREALDPAVADQLLAEFPPLEVMTGGKPYGSNQRFGYPASEAVHDPAVTPLWRRFVAVHVSQPFLGELLRLFADDIRRTYPAFEQRFGPIESLRAGIRYRDDYRTADVLLEAQPSVNTPVTATPNSVRAGHLDNPNKLFVGLYYLRHPDDQSTGGDLELYRYTTDRPVFEHHEIDDRYIEAVQTVRYERNTLVVFMNSKDALHGVTVRSQTPTTRLFLNLGAEVSADLFTIPGGPSRRPVAIRARTAARRSPTAAQQHALAATLLVLSSLFLVFGFLPEVFDDRPYDVFGLRADLTFDAVSLPILIGSLLCTIALLRPRSTRRFTRLFR
jgi:hypothetical protein